jgi:anthranilate phosphoribosyltransferase
MSVFHEHLKRLLDGQVLSRREARQILAAIADGEGSPAQLAAFLTALKLRGETFEELVGFVELMRARLVPVRVSRRPLVDACGTGGDGLGTFNISTTAALVAAGAGAAVAKHGNRGVSSKSGSADVLEALGVRTDLGAERVALCVEKAGIGFLFAPAYHPALKPLGPIRKELGVRTVFNALGPMCNPALPRHQVMGVYADSLLVPAARVLGELGAKRALVVRSQDGLDEFSVGAPTRVVEWTGRGLKKYSVDARSLGLKRSPVKALAGGDPRRNAAIVREVLSGKKGPKSDVVALNAAAVLYACGLSDSLKDGLSLAQASISRGWAQGALDDLRRLSHG